MITNIKNKKHGLLVYEFCNLWYNRLGDDKFDTFIKRQGVLEAIDRYGFQEFCELWYTKLGDKFVTFMTDGIAASFDKKGFKEFCEHSHANAIHDYGTSGDQNFVTFMISGIVSNRLEAIFILDTSVRRRQEAIKEEIQRFKSDTEFKIYLKRSYIAELILIEAFLKRDIQKYKMWKSKLLNFNLEMIDILRDDNESVKLCLTEDGQNLTGEIFTGEYAFVKFCDMQKKTNDSYQYYEKFCENFEVDANMQYEYRTKMITKIRDELKV